MSIIEGMRSNNYCCHAEAVQIIREGEATRVAISITVDYSYKFVPYIKAIYYDILARFTMSTEPRIERYYTVEMCQNSNNFMRPVKHEKKNLYSTDIYLYLYNYKECGNLKSFISDLNYRYFYSGSVCFVIDSLNITFKDIKNTLNLSAADYRNMDESINVNITLRDCEFVSIVKNCDAFSKITFINTRAMLYSVRPLVPRIYIPDEDDPYLAYALTTAFFTEENVMKAFEEHFKATIAEKGWLPCNGYVVNLTDRDMLANSRTRFIMDKDSSVANIIFGHNLVEVFSNTNLVEASITRDREAGGFHDPNIPTGLPYNIKYDNAMYACNIPKDTYKITGQGFGDFIQAKYRMINLKIYNKQIYVEHW